MSILFHVYVAPIETRLLASRHRGAAALGMRTPYGVAIQPRTRKFPRRTAECMQVSLQKVFLDKQMVLTATSCGFSCVRIQTMIALH
jgi:hypothetical protein